MSVKSAVWTGGADPIENGCVDSLMVSSNGLIFTRIPVVLFSKRDRLKLETHSYDTKIEFWYIGNRPKARVVNSLKSAAVE